MPVQTNGQGETLLTVPPTTLRWEESSNTIRHLDTLCSYFFTAFLVSHDIYYDIYEIADQSIEWYKQGCLLSLYHMKMSVTPYFPTRCLDNRCKNYMETDRSLWAWLVTTKFWVNSNCCLQYLFLCPESIGCYWWFHYINIRV